MQNIESNGPIEQLNEGFKDAVLEFIRGSRDVNIWRLGPLEFFDYLVPKDFVNLTRFYFDCYGDSTVFNTIIRNNAGTLRALYADYEVDYRIDTILYNENRDPIA
ncbi:hypothetical protein FB639_002532 [Coemansia asiatica]|nr:hypothetical protein FB639_002532 [Coemansia asiatica]